jgi:hypothetical protein
MMHLEPAIPRSTHEPELPFITLAGLLAFLLETNALDLNVACH